MQSLQEITRAILESSHTLLTDNLRNLTLAEALSSAGGYRSVIGVLKHLGGWVHVYRAYALDPDPKHFEHTSWPRGLRDTIDPSREYLDEVIAWIGEGMKLWDEGLCAIDDFESPRPCHWGATAPLFSIVLMVANHLAYHTGELNMLLSIARGEAWEYGEEVEENHIDTFGHGVRGPWMDDATARFYQDKVKASREGRLSS